MVTILVVTHGKIASELVAAASAMAGETDGVEPIGLDGNETPESARSRIGEAILRHAGPDGILLLTDVFGGTPANFAFPFLQDDQVEIVTGVNLPMLLRALSGRGRERPSELARSVADRGRKSIEVASELLSQKSAVRLEKAE